MNERQAKTQALAEIIKPARDAAWHADFCWYDLEAGLARLADPYGGCNMEPDFQRGHVWTVEQQTHFIENNLRNLLPSSALVVQFNCPNWDNYEYKGAIERGFECLDGLQRIKAVTEWTSGRVKPFGLTLDELAGTSFEPRRMGYRFNVHVFSYQTRAEVLQHYLDHNTGGTQHSQEEITRVRKLYYDALESK